MTSNSLSIELLELNPHDLAFATDWERIRNQISNQNPFMTIEWLQSIKEAYGADFPFKTYLKLKKGQETVGIIPITRSKQKILGPLEIPAITLTHSGPGAPDHIVLLIQREYFTEGTAALFEWLNKQKERAWIFKDFSQEAPLFKNLKNSLSNRGKIIQLPGTDCPFLDLSKITNKEKWLKENFHVFIRKRRKLEREHKVERGYVENAVQLEEALSNYLIFHKKRFGLNSPIIQSQANFNLLKHFCEKLLPLGKLRLLYIKVDGNYAAIQISFLGGKSLYSYQLSFNDDYRSYSVGGIRDVFQIENSFNQGLERIDLLRGDEGYKKRFTSDSTKDRTIIVLKNDLMGLALYCAILTKNFIKKLILRRKE